MATIIKNNKRKEDVYLKLRSKIFAGIGILLVIMIITVSVNQKSKTDEPNSTAANDTSLQQESKQVKEDENLAEDPAVSKSSDDPESVETDPNNETTTSVNEVSKAEALPEANDAGGQATTSPIEDDTVDPSTETSTGLHFSSREEAIAFGFSRFTPEEIAIYNRAAEVGLTPEQEEMAIQIAYSRFSQAEIAAIEEALGR